MSPEIELAYLQELDAIEHAREDFAGFVQYVRPGYEMNWHHAVLCNKLQQFAKKKIRRLMVFMPPRRGKSELCSRLLPAYLFGKDPNAQVIAASYAIGLASRMNRDVQKTIRSKRYRNVFPDVRIPGKGVFSSTGDTYVANSEMFEIIDHDGQYLAAGVGTGITGEGFDFGIIDDPIKDMAQAMSKTYRDSVWDWYQSTFLTRSMGYDDCILLILTRWHEDDLAGRLLKLAEADPDADQWEMVKFPEIKESDTDPLDPRQIGEVIWPSRYPASRVRAMRASSGSIVWAGLFQQRPSLAEGGILKRKWWRYWFRLPDRFDDKIITADPTMTSGDNSDFCVFQCWGRKGPDKYLIDQIRGQWDYPTSKRELRAFIQKHTDRLNPISAIRVENKANGPALVSELSADIPGIVPFNPVGSKESRAISHANSASAQLEAGNILLPNPKSYPWVSEFIDEAADFPKGKNDDMVDTFTMAILHWVESAADSWGDYRGDGEPADSIVADILAGVS